MPSPRQGAPCPICGAARKSWRHATCGNEGCAAEQKRHRWRVSAAQQRRDNGDARRALGRKFSQTDHAKERRTQRDIERRARNRDEIRNAERERYKRRQSDPENAAAMKKHSRAKDARKTEQQRDRERIRKREQMRARYEAIKRDPDRHAAFLEHRRERNRLKRLSEIMINDRDN